MKTLTLKRPLNTMTRRNYNVLAWTHHVARQQRTFRARVCYALQVINGRVTDLYR